jgi:excisionase family DNA binding protein
MSDILTIEALAEDRSSYLALSKILAAAGRGEGGASACIHTPDGSAPIPPSFCSFLYNVTAALAAGTMVAMMPTGEELSTQEAADLLNVSRPYVIKLCETGVIPFTTVGRHRRVLFGDVAAYKAQRDAHRRAGVLELIAELTARDRANTVRGESQLVGSSGFLVESKSP